MTYNLHSFFYIYTCFNIGHKLSTKIKTEINKISKKIEVEILKYQNLRSNSKSMTSIFPEVKFNDIVNHSSNFWKSFNLTIEEDTDIP